MAEDFSVGDKVVYPGHGVAEVTGLERREISGAALEFYVLKVLENNMKVMVPKHNADSVGLRRLVGSEQVEEVYGVLKHRGAKISTATWNRRLAGRDRHRAARPLHPAVGQGAVLR